MNNEQTYVERFFECNQDPVDILNRVTDSLTLTEWMFDSYAAIGNPLSITDDDLSIIRQANQILIDQYYMAKGDTE